MPARQGPTAQKQLTPIRMRPEAAMDPWQEQAKEILRQEMFRRKLTFKNLARRLASYGIEETPDQLNRKVNRGKFSAAFLFACLAAMEVEVIRVPSQLGR